MKAYTSRYNLRPGEARGQCNSGRYAAQELTQAETAEVMGISRQAVQQIERRALYKMWLGFREWEEEFRETGMLPRR